MFNGEIYWFGAKDQFTSNYDIVVVVATCYCCSGVVDLEVRTSRIPFMVDAHIFQHTPVEIGMEFYLRTVLFCTDRIG